MHVPHTVPGEYRAQATFSGAQRSNHWVITAPSNIKYFVMIHKGDFTTEWRDFLLEKEI